jgi:hypothetical protein
VFVDLVGGALSGLRTNVPSSITSFGIGLGGADVVCTYAIGEDDDQKAFFVSSLSRAEFAQSGLAEIIP